MSHRRLLAIPLLLLALAIACGSDSKSPEAYFEAIEAAKSDHDVALPPDLFTSSSDQEVIAWLHQEDDVLGAFIEQLDSLDVPDSVLEAHRSVVQISQERIAAQEEIAATYPEDDSVSIREPLRELWYGAVCDLQGHAREEGITIDLGCEAEQAMLVSTTSRPTVLLPSGTVECAFASNARTSTISQGQVTFALWFNRFDHPVRLYRYEQPGQRELVTTLAAKSTSVQITYIGTGWLVTDEQDNCLGGIFPGPLPGWNVDIRPD